MKYRNYSDVAQKYLDANLFRHKLRQAAKDYRLTTQEIRTLKGQSIVDLEGAEKELVRLIQRKEAEKK